ncbi:MAG: site-specific DNA-methyltransferase, partial [Synergistaceae bacterium]|nr:site-specific DNA-methyltransferase [Synergistaceae bacterium]
MQIEYLSVSELKPYEGNPRIHNEKQIEKLISSIQEFGFVLPVLIDCENVIIAGHAKVLAALKINMPEVPCVRASHLSEAQRKAYILADNRLAEDSEWDKNLLKTEMLKLRDDYGLELESTGFESREILRLRMDIAETPKNEDLLPEEVKNPVSQPGDIWQLGEHRIICGNCTDPDTVSKLLQGEKPHLMITDPPYGVNYDPAWRNQIRDSQALRTGKVLNDDKADWREAWALFPGDVAYVWHASMHAQEVIESLQVCN